MVKGDVKRDYYAELEIGKDADITDIKRQFRKLALRYHPDRNPGHEEEFNAKFQAIQSAHEILADPVLKARYDADRARLGHGWGSAPPRPNVPSPNPYAVYSEFPPPPRRPQQPRPAAPAATGANRYAAFNRPFGPTRSKEDSTARTNASNAYRAFENMNRPSRTPRPGPNPVPPPTPPRDARPPPPNPLRRTGFDPATPGGDEPPATRRSSYVHVDPIRRAAEPGLRQPHMPAPATPEPAPTHGRGGATTATSPIPEHHEAWDGPRLRTPYATSGGERICLSGDPLRRSATVRERVQPSTPDRHRSASPLRNRAVPGSVRPVARSKTGPSTPSESPTKLAPSGVNLPSSSSPSAAAAAASAAPRRGRSPQPRARSFAHYVQSDTSSDEAHESSSESPSLADRLAAENRMRGRRRTHGRRYPYPMYDPAHGPSRDASTDAPPGRPEDGPPKRRLDDRMDAFMKRRSSGTMDDGDLRPEGHGGLRIPRPKVTIEAEPTFGPAPAGGGSNVHIDTQFSPAGWNGTFTSNRREYFPSQSSGKGTTASVSDAGASSSGRAPKDGGRPTIVGPPVLASTATAADGVSLEKSNPGPAASDRSTRDAFEARYWTEQLKQQSWGLPLQAPTSPSRATATAAAASGSRPRSMSRIKNAKGSTTIVGASTRPMVPRPASVRTSSDESDEDDILTSAPPLPNRIRPSPDRESNGDGSAMDIDPSTPPVGERGAVGVHWPRPSSAGAPAPQMLKPSPSSTAGPAIQRTSSGWVPPSSNRLAPPALPVTRPGGLTGPGGSSSSTELDLSQLKRVEPLAPTAHGLSDMNDMRSTLPFPSQAEKQPPIAESNYEPQALELPSPPKPPVAPDSLAQASWERYVATLRVYLFEWSQFVDRMLSHFNERQREAKFCLAPNCLGLLGEGGGFLKYMKGIEEDVRVRAHWDVAWEKHRASMKAFGLLRNMAMEKSLQAS